MIGVMAAPKTLTVAVPAPATLSPAVTLPAAAPAVPLIERFALWMTSEQRRIYGLCYHMLQDRDEADSATQDVFLKAYRALQKPGTEEPTEPAKWLTRIAVNTCLDRLRSRRWQFWRRRAQANEEQDTLDHAVVLDPPADDWYFATQIRERLGAAIARLSDRQRAVFTLRHYENLSMEEIAGVLGLDTGTVKAHMHRAVSKLRIELRDLYGGRA
jgi:RNA polymerase sigma-70 factor (ECF subfamily)